MFLSFKNWRCIFLSVWNLTLNVIEGHIYNVTSMFKNRLFLEYVFSLKSDLSLNDNILKPWLTFYGSYGQLLSLLILMTYFNVQLWLNLKLYDLVKNVDYLCMY